MYSVILRLFLLIGLFSTPPTGILSRVPDDNPGLEEIRQDPLAGDLSVLPGIPAGGFRALVAVNSFAGAMPPSAKEHPSTTLRMHPAAKEQPSTSLRMQAPTAQAAPTFGILSPQPGEAVRGLLTIQGTTAVQGFVKAEVAFSYAETPDTWFLLAESTAPVENGTLAQWDTGTITDGNYALRLLVTLEDGSQQSMTVEGIRVRNYSPVETLTPTPTPQGTPLRPTPTVTTTPTRTPVPPTPTPLPPNPAGLPGGEVLTMLGKGALFVLGTFAGLGIYQRARKLLRRDR